MWGQSDTLWAADIIGQVSKGSEYRTSADSLATDVESASDYLQKDSRFNLKQYTPGSVVASSFGGASSEQSRVLWDGIDISSMATGVLDLSLVPAMMLSTTSIVDGINGGASSNMGSMGALNLNLSPKIGRGTATAVGLTSLDELTLNAHSWGSFFKIRYQSIVRFTSSDNEYDYRLGPLEGRMVGNGYGDLTYLQRFSGAMGKTYWSSDLWYTQSEKNNSGSILSPGYINHLEDEVVRFKYKLKGAQRDEALCFARMAGLHRYDVLLDAARYQYLWPIHCAIHSHGKTLPCTPVVEPIYGRGDEQNSNGMDAAGAAESKAEPRLECGAKGRSVPRSSVLECLCLVFAFKTTMAATMVGGELLSIAHT